MDHEGTSRLPPAVQDSPDHVGQPKSTSKSAGILGHDEATHHALRSDHGSRHVEAKPSDSANEKPKSVAPLSLRHREQPLPFILPQPLGPLPTPAQSAAAIFTAARRNMLPASFPVTEYQRNLESHHQRAVASYIGPTDSGMRQPFSMFPSPPDLTRRQSLGSLSSQTTYLPPPLPTYPLARRSTSPAFHQGHPQTAALQANPGTLSTHTDHPAFWSSSPSTPEGSIPGMPLSGPRPSRAAEHVRYQCDQCPESFPTNGILKRHKKTHSARKYRCGCGAAYTDKSVLRVSSTNMEKGGAIEKKKEKDLRIYIGCPSPPPKRERRRRRRNVTANDGPNKR